MLGELYFEFSKESEEIWGVKSPCAEEKVDWKKIVMYFRKIFLLEMQNRRNRLEKLSRAL